MMSTTTNSSNYHQFPHFSIDLNQQQQQQYYLYDQAAHFFTDTTSSSGTTSMVLDHHRHQLPPSSSSSLPYHIFIDVEDPYDAPFHHPQQQQQQKANDGVVATEKAKWVPAACTTNLRMSKKNNKLTIKTNSDHGHGRPKKYSSASSSSCAARDPQKMNNDTSPSTLQQQQAAAGMATDHHNDSPLCTSTSPTVVLRVCADCNTSKTPLWRSGPRGPKSLCNACGIRQRKARRAMAAAAAAAEGTDLPVLPRPATTIKLKTGAQKGKNANKHRLAPSTNSHLPFKKRCKFTAAQPRGRKATTNTSIGSSSKNKGTSHNNNNNNNGKLCLEDLVAILSKSASAFQRVFPQDEKEAAILLMALSRVDDCTMIVRSDPTST